MGKYKVNLDGKLPDERKIQQHMDFKKLLVAHHEAQIPFYKRPLYHYKNKRWLFLVMIIALLAYLVAELIFGF